MLQGQLSHDIIFHGLHRCVDLSLEFSAQFWLLFKIHDQIGRSNTNSLSACQEHTNDFIDDFVIFVFKNVVF